MKNAIIVDTGVLVAYLNRREQFHEWTKTQLKEILPPLLTCEAVVAESCFLLQDLPHGSEKLLELLESGFILTPFRFADDIDAIKALMLHYTNVPMSFADACLVRMSELYVNSKVLTLDSDFTIYRKHKRQVIPVIMPENV